MDKILSRIMNSDDWPSIQMPENLELLNEIADNSFELTTFEGMLAATLMYHQILEAMCMHILEDCYFYIQLSVYPAEIEFKIPKDKMFGYYINELKKVKGCFDKIYDLYNDIQDEFRVIFHSYKKDTFIDYLTDEEYNNYFG